MIVQVQKTGISRGKNVFHGFHGSTVDFTGLPQKQPILRTRDTVKKEGPCLVLTWYSISLLTTLFQILQVIVTFDQTKATITKALQIIKDWNPTWEPTISMTDMDLGEINGLKAVFPSLKHQMLCDFHVQQAWNREVKGFFKGEPGRCLTAFT